MIRSLHRSLVWLVLLPVVLYRRWGFVVRPMNRLPTCNFMPTCSQYALDAVKTRGIVVGIALTMWRVLRCNPFVHGGYDPVPCRHHREALSAQEQH